jgi:hypothetical protein
MDKRHDIVQRKYDEKWVVWSQIDDPESDLDYYRKNGLPVPQKWIIVAVAFSKEEAERASRRSRI